MLKEALLKDIILGLSQRVVEGWKGSTEGNGSICKMGLSSQEVLAKNLEGAKGSWGEFNTADDLEKLVKAGHLKEFLVDQEEVNLGKSLGSQANNMFIPPLGIIEVVHAISKGVSMSHRKGVLSVVTSPEVDVMDRLEKRLTKTLVSIMFNKEDLEETS
nr:hypothetical protein CFP56_66193 [Quercus suber]